MSTGTGTKSAAKKTSKAAATKTSKTAATKPASTAKKASKTAATKPASTAKKTSKTAAPAARKPAPLVPNDLLSRTLSAIESVPASTWTSGEAAAITDEILAALDVCLAAGRLDLATTIAGRIPAVQRGRVLAHLAFAGHADPEAALEALVLGLPLADRGAGSAELAAFALAAVTKLPASPRAAEVDAAVAAVVDACFEAEWTHDLGPVVDAYMERGDRAAVAAMIERAGEELSEALARGVWALEDPAKIRPLVDRSNADGALQSRWIDVRAWSLDDLRALASVARGTWAPKPLGTALMACGRVADARALLLDDPEWDTFYLSWKIERYLLAGDEAAAKAALEGSPPPTEEFLLWARMQVEYGLRDFHALWPIGGKWEKGRSVMHSIQTITLLIVDALARGDDPSGFGPALAAIDALFANPTRSQYDRGVEGSRRNEVAMIRARLAIANGNLAAAQAQIDADLAAIAGLLAHAKDAYGRAELLREFAARAIVVDRPDVALKAAKKIPPSYRSAHAATIARGFLPSGPGDAIKALDQLATDPAKRLLHGRGLLAALWSAVLPPATQAAAAT
ncbi:MAG: hypothetical protein R3B09_03060 [Nannocystaceae bacterium]